MHKVAKAPIFGGSSASDALGITIIIIMLFP